MHLVCSRRLLASRRLVLRRLLSTTTEHGPTPRASVATVEKVQIQLDERFKSINSDLSNIIVMKHPTHLSDQSELHDLNPLPGKTPQEMVDYLNQFIVGQDSPKRRLAIAFSKLTKFAKFHPF
jgi:hypothetical protein